MSSDTVESSEATPSGPRSFGWIQTTWAVGEIAGASSSRRNATLTSSDLRSRSGASMKSPPRLTLRRVPVMRRPRAQISIGRSVRARGRPRGESYSVRRRTVAIKVSRSRGLKRTASAPARTAAA